MQVQIACRHGSISESLREHVLQKSEKLLTYFERVTAIEVTFDFQGERVRVEMLVDAEHKHNFVSHDEGEDAYTMYDSVLQKMEQQIRKYKEKVQDHRRDRPMGELTRSDEAGAEDSAAN